MLKNLFSLSGALIALALAPFVRGFGVTVSGTSLIVDTSGGTFATQVLHSAASTSHLTNIQSLPGLVFTGQHLSL